MEVLFDVFKVLLASNFNMRDLESSAANLFWHINQLDYGEFERVWQRGKAITTFSQADVDTWLVGFLANALNGTCRLFLADNISQTKAFNCGISVTATHNTESGDDLWFSLTIAACTLFLLIMAALIYTKCCNKAKKQSAPEAENADESSTTIEMPRMNSRPGRAR